MVQAHVIGALDFTDSERYNPMWQAKESMVLRYLVLQRVLKVKELRHLQHSAAIPASYQHHFEAADELFHDLEKMLMPWVERDEDGMPLDEQESRLSEWEHEIGIKVGSPEWDELIRQQELYNKMREEMKAST